MLKQKKTKTEIVMKAELLDLCKHLKTVIAKMMQIRHGHVNKALLSLSLLSLSLCFVFAFGQ